MTFMFKKYTLSSHINQKCVTWVDYRGLKTRFQSFIVPKVDAYTVEEVELFSVFSNGTVLENLLYNLLK